MKFITQLFWGANVTDTVPKEGSIKRRIKNIQLIWNNEYHDDIGVERLIRLFLAVSQFFFIGTYVREVFGRHSSLSRDFSIDVLVILKVVFSVLCVKYEWYNNNYILILQIWLMTETLLYIPTLIFASDYLARPRSYRRAILLFFFNYIEIAVDFATLYSKFAIMSKPFEHWFDSMYFSFISGSSTGFGDYYPLNLEGKCISVTHTLVSIIFIVLFLNSFSSKMEISGYFQVDKNIKDNNL
jgi:hypothetical protein